VGLHLFFKHIIRPPIKDHVINAILSQIEFERDGHDINRSAVKGCVTVLLSLDVEQGGVSVYQQELEPAILRDSTSYYAREGERLVETCDAPEFFRRVRPVFLDIHD
jgi:cullin 3